MKPASAWLAVCALLAGGALVGHALPHQALSWHAAAPAQAWRWWTAAFVHWSHWHLAANLMGLALVAALGRAAAAPASSARAWLLAWPSTHLALLLRPDLIEYGGLSGVLHAGVAVLGCHLASRHNGRNRHIGAALLAGMGLKLLLEAPWGPPLRHPPDWDIAIAPFAHATGAIAGVIAALLLDRRR